MRRILVLRRVVPLDRWEEYAAGWQRLAAVCGLRGAHAWVFRRSGHEDHLVEFVEWQEPVQVVEDAEVSEALRALDEVAPGSMEELEEASP